MLPNKARGVPRGDDRRVLNGIFWVLRSGAPWRDLPTAFGPHTTCYNRFVRWGRAGVWSRIVDALTAAHDAAVQMIDTSIVRVHQHGACLARNKRQAMGRSRGGLTSKIHAVLDGNGLPVRLALAAGQVHDNRIAAKLLWRLRSRTLLQSISVPGSQSGRVVFQQDQAVSACGNALRQARCQLPRVHPACASIRLWLRVNGSTP
jgi:transposase